MDAPLSQPTPQPPTPAAPTAQPPRRRGTIVGLTAGVLGGGLVGLAMTVPSFTDAAGDAPVAVVQQTDESGTESTTDETAPPQPGVRLRDALQALVDDGTLTTEQADAVAEHLAGQLPERAEHRGDHRGDHRGEHGRGGRPGMDGEVVAELLGIEASELRSALRDGQSIAQLAEANGVDVQTVVDALVDEAASHLDLAVENGRLTEEEAAEKLADVTERITERVNGERPNAD